MVTNNNLRNVITTCERSRVQASPCGFFFRNEKGVGLILNLILGSFPTLSEAHRNHSPASANEEDTNDVGTINNVTNNFTTVGPTLAGNGVVSSTAITTPTPGMSTSSANVTGELSWNSVNFLTLITPAGNEVDVVFPVESIRAISE
nr:hypothetical protein [Tanacetum cinerariifolium]